MIVSLGVCALDVNIPTDQGRAGGIDDEVAVDRVVVNRIPQIVELNNSDIIQIPGGISRRTRSKRKQQRCHYQALFEHSSSPLPTLRTHAFTHAYGQCEEMHRVMKTQPLRKPSLGSTD